MDTSSSFTSFTITQPFNGAPLQFQPAHGSRELEALIDAFIPGPAAKQDKLSQVTIDFFNNATVDISNGSRVRQYNVVLYNQAPRAFEQSPTTSQSSSNSPPMFTPSPASSTFAESIRGSISMTPPTRTHGGRVAKKPKKETKKAAEANIPGFKIMTRDGIDVTSSAGRGTKTKEQREHAHLMRIMKACDSCKKKKIRVSLPTSLMRGKLLMRVQCDPSHRRSHTDMSRTSTKTSSSSQTGPSPSASAPFLSQESTNGSVEGALPSTGISHIADFLLFPEESAWNASDELLPSFNSNYDLNDFSNFNYDVNNSMNDFDFSAFEQSNTQQSLAYSFTNNQHGLDQWSGLFDTPVISQSTTYPSISSQDSGQLDSSWYSADSGDSSGLEFSDSPSPGGEAMIHQTSSVGQKPVLHDGTFANTSSSSSPAGYNSLTSTPFGDDSPGVSQDESAPVPSGNRKERRSRNSQGTLSRAAIQRLVDAVPSYTPSHPLADFSDQQGDAQAWSVPGYNNSPLDGHGGGNYQAGFNGGAKDVYISGIENISATVNTSIAILTSAQPDVQALSSHLLQLRETLDKMDSSQLGGILPNSLLSSAQSLTSELQGVVSRVEHASSASRRSSHQGHRPLDPVVNPEIAQQCMINVQAMSKSLSELIDRAQTHNMTELPSATLSSHTRQQTSAYQEPLHLLTGWDHNVGSDSSAASSTDNSNPLFSVIQREDGSTNVLNQVLQAQEQVPSLIETSSEIHRPTSTTSREELSSRGSVANLSSIPRIEVIDLEPSTPRSRARVDSLVPQQPSLAELTSGRHGFFPQPETGELRTRGPAYQEVEGPSIYDSTIAQPIANTSFSTDRNHYNTSSPQLSEGLPSSTSYSDQSSGSSTPTSPLAPEARAWGSIPQSATRHDETSYSLGRVLHAQLLGDGLDVNLLFYSAAIAVYALFATNVWIPNVCLLIALLTCARCFIKQSLQVSLTRYLSSSPSPVSPPPSLP